MYKVGGRDPQKKAQFWEEERDIPLPWPMSWHTSDEQLYSPSCNRKLDHKQSIKYYNLLQNWQKPFSETYVSLQT